MGDLETSFENDLLIVSRHLPLESIHANARAAAIASEAAARQGMFDAMADQLFTNQAQWSDPGVTDPTALFESYATGIGLDINQFRVDVADPELDARVTRDAADAGTLGIGGTPYFNLQGTQLPNPPTEAAFAQAIQNAIDELDQPLTIDRTNGEIILRDAALLDALGVPVITLPVIVSDTEGNSESIEVTVNVTN